MEEAIQPSSHPPSTTAHDIDLCSASLQPIEETIDLKLKTELARLPKTPMFPCTVGKLEKFSTKNRSKDIVPYDHNRVILQGSSVSMVEEESDYINASFIRGTTSEDGYIATQGPKLGTVDDLWSMVWSQNSRLLVMLSRLVEHSRNQSYKYWPDVGDCLDTDDIVVSTESTDERYSHTIRTLVLQNKKTKNSRKIIHLQFTVWPEKSMPSVPTFVLFWKTFKRLNESATGPPVIHCSDGSERTGLLIGLDLLFNQWEGSTSRDGDIYNCVLRLREDRVGFVTTEEEYKFLYQVIREACRSHCSARHLEPSRETDGRQASNTPSLMAVTMEHIQQEYQCLHEEKATRSVSSKSTWNNNDFWDSVLLEVNSEVHGPSYRFLAGSGAVSFTCVPLNHRILTRASENKLSRLRRSISLQEHTDQLGIGGVLPADCKNSFLVTGSVDITQDADFWHMLFNTGCRTVVRLLSSQEQLQTQTEKWPLVTSDFTVTLTSDWSVGNEVRDTMFALCSDFEPITPLDRESLSDPSVKMISFCCSHDNHTVPTNTTMSLVFKLMDKWLTQTHTTLVAVQASDGLMTAAEFCTSCNALASIHMDRGVDIFLIARTVQCHLEQTMSEAAYDRLYRLCQQHNVDNCHLSDQLSFDGSNVTTCATSSSADA